MKPYFSTTDRLNALEIAAQKWAGTPFRHGSCCMQAGASCVGAVAGMLWTAGFDFEQYPSGRADWSRYQTESLMEKWLDARPGVFEPAQIDDLSPGDVVGFKVGHCVHHLGIILAGGRFFQCSESLGTVILSQEEPMFRKRLARAWRPVQ